MDSCQKHMKETCGVFKVEEGSSSGDSKLGENQGWHFRRYDEGFHPRYSQSDRKYSL